MPTQHLLSRRPDLIVLVCGVLAGAVGHQLRGQFEEHQGGTARDRITNLFGQHVSPQVVDRLMAEGTRTDSDICRVAVMFVDFRSFTAGARTRTPQEVVDRLDGAFAILVEILIATAVSRTSSRRRISRCSARRWKRRTRRTGRSPRRAKCWKCNARVNEATLRPCASASAFISARAVAGRHRLAAAQGIHRDSATP